MSKIKKMVGSTSMALDALRCDYLAPLGFKGLTCFVGRLDAYTTSQELHDYLTSVGIKGVVCKRLVPKEGRVFKSAASRVSCCLESRDMFYSEANWPAGAELRDWFFIIAMTNLDAQTTTNCRQSVALKVLSYNMHGFYNGKPCESY